VEQRKDVIQKTNLYGFQNKQRFLFMDGFLDHYSNLQDIKQEQNCVYAFSNAQCFLFTSDF